MPSASEAAPPPPLAGHDDASARTLAVQARSEAAGRLVLAGLGILAGEILARQVCDVAGLPHGRWFIFDTLARLGRLSALAATAGLALAALGLLSARSAWARRLFDAIARGRDHLCGTTPAARMLVVFAALSLALTPLAARRYQLAWRAAAVYACAGLALAMAVELVFAMWRTRRRLARTQARNAGQQPATPGSWAGPTWVGRTLWVALLSLLGYFVFPRIAGFELAVAATAGLLVMVVPAVRLPRALLAVLGASVLVGVAVDVRMPSLRRFASVHAPFSSLGLAYMRQLTDLDGDGSSRWLGFDCDDFDSERHPKADDVPGNGVDEDCSGADAEVIAPPPTSAPPPRDPGRPRPDVFLVTVDALRADALDLMPRTRLWAERCFRFDPARAVSNFTALAVSALLTGTEPRYLRANYRIAIIPPPTGDDPHPQSQPPTLATVLRRAGYFGGAVVPFQPPLLFLFHGFEDVRVPPSRRLTTGANEVLAQARSALERRPAGQPFLLWTHLLDTHAPYAGGTKSSDYRRAAAALDGPLADFLASLPAHAVVVLTADHGEAFGEHGHYTHEATLFDEELRVPLVLCAPAEADLGSPRRLSALVSTLDVTPTLIDLADGGPFAALGGSSLLPYLRHPEEIPHAFIRVEGWLPQHHLQGVVAGCYKWMRDLAAEWEALFDLCLDPGERDDIAGRHPDVVRSLRVRVFESAAIVPAWLVQARALTSGVVRQKAAPESL